MNPHFPIYNSTFSSYYPFGMLQPNRHGGEYRYGMNGMEQDNEVKGKGNSYTAMYWQYDSRLAKRWNVDPVVKTHESPYATFANNPIWFVDPSGADSTVYLYNSSSNKNVDLSKIAQQSKSVYNLNGVSWQKYKVISSQKEFDNLKLDPSDSKVIFDNGEMSGSIGNTVSYTLSYININAVSNSVSEAGYVVAHELLHQYLNRSGQFYYSYVYFFQPDMDFYSSGSHYNGRDGLGDYPNLNTSGETMSDQNGWNIPMSFPKKGMPLGAFQIPDFQLSLVKDIPIMMQYQNYSSNSPKTHLGYSKQMVEIMNGRIDEIMNANKFGKSSTTLSPASRSSFSQFWNHDNENQGKPSKKFKHEVQY